MRCTLETTTWCNNLTAAQASNPSLLLQLERLIRRHQSRSIAVRESRNRFCCWCRSRPSSEQGRPSLERGGGPKDPFHDVKKECRAGYFSEFDDVPCEVQRTWPGRPFTHHILHLYPHSASRYYPWGTDTTSGSSSRQSSASGAARSLRLSGVRLFVAPASHIVPHATQ